MEPKLLPKLEQLAVQIGEIPFHSEAWKKEFHLIAAEIKQTGMSFPEWCYYINATIRGEIK